MSGQIKTPEPTLLEITEQYTAWCNVITNPEHAAKMRLHYIQLLHHKAAMALSAEQDRTERVCGENNDKKLPAEAV